MSQCTTGLDGVRVSTSVSVVGARVSLPVTSSGLGSREGIGENTWCQESLVEELFVILQQPLQAPSPDQTRGLPTHTAPALKSSKAKQTSWERPCPSH